MIRKLAFPQASGVSQIPPSERMIAVSIERSPSHVHFMAAAWRMMASRPGTDMTFSEAYRAVQGRSSGDARRRQRHCPGCQCPDVKR